MLERATVRVSALESRGDGPEHAQWRGIHDPAGGRRAITGARPPPVLGGHDLRQRPDRRQFRGPARFEPATPARIAHSLAPLLAMFSAARLDSFESATALPGPADYRDRLQVASSKAYGSSKRKGRRKSIARVAAPAARSGSNSWLAPS